MFFAPEASFSSPSVIHVFFLPHRRLLRTPHGQAYAVEVGRYFERVDCEIERWLFSAAPEEAKAGFEPFEVPTFHRTLADCLNAIIRAGFLLDRVAEPLADDDTACRVPAVEDTRVVPYFLHVRGRKP